VSGASLVGRGVAVLLVACRVTGCGRREIFAARVLNVPWLMLVDMMEKVFEDMVRKRIVCLIGP